MRVTQSMQQRNLMNHLFQSQSRMDKYMNQINTGKKNTKPSDDPVAAVRGMDYRTTMAEIEQFSRNTSEVWTWMEHSDDAMDKGTKVMQRMEELAVQAANDSYSEDERNSIQKEINQLKEQLKEIGNTNVNGKYIFNGTDTDKAPIDMDENGEVTVHIDRPTHPVEMEVSKGVRFPVNITPEEVFNDDLFAKIASFEKALQENDSEAMQSSVGGMQEAAKGFVHGRAELGARMNRLELIEDRLEKQSITTEDAMAQNEGVEFEEAITNLLSEEAVHRAALASGAKIIQPSLIDFLR